MQEYQQRVLSAFRGARNLGGGRYRVLCPAHEDTSPSLDLDFDRAEDGRVLLICRAGCEQHSVIQAAGLRAADLFPPDYSHASAGRKHQLAKGVPRMTGYEALQALRDSAHHVAALEVWMHDIRDLIFDILDDTNGSAGESIMRQIAITLSEDRHRCEEAVAQLRLYVTRAQNA